MGRTATMLEILNWIRKTNTRIVTIAPAGGRSSSTALAGTAATAVTQYGDVGLGSVKRPPFTCTGRSQFRIWAFLAQTTPGIAPDHGPLLNIASCCLHCCRMLVILTDPVKCQTLTVRTDTTALPGPCCHSLASFDDASAVAITAVLLV